jgi:hypothetical protein
MPIHKDIDVYVEHKLMHLKQHYNYELSKILFKKINLSKFYFDLMIYLDTDVEMNFENNYTLKTTTDHIVNEL